MLSQRAGAWDFWPLPMAEADVAQDTIGYVLEARAVSSSGQFAPFWLQTQRDGAVAASAHSGTLTAGVVKQATRPARWWDYDFGVTVTGQLHSRLPMVPDKTYERVGTAYTNSLYAHVRLYVFDVTAGVRRLSFNSADDELTMGSLLFSGNARPMPRVSVGIDRWTAFPGLYGYLELKGGIDHLWQCDDVYVTRGFIHHKYIGARVGGTLPVRLSYQFHHVAQWGGYSPTFGDLGNDLRAFLTAFKAGAGGSMANDQLNAQGNHIGEQQVALDVRVSDWTVTAYWHAMFEDGPIRFIGFGMNNRDGLWGVNIRQTRCPYIESVTYELAHTTDQSGPFHDRDGMIYGGADNYYQNSIYRNGWNYQYRTIGLPFITSPVYNVDGSIATRNNRILAHYVGVRGDVYGFRYRAVCSYVRNYGLYSVTSGTQLISTNTAWMLEVTKHVDEAWGLDFGLTLGGDIGAQFGNTFGAMVTITKRGILKIHE